MKQHWTKPLNTFVKNPKVQFSMGCLLLIITVSDLFFLKAEHSILVIAVFHISYGLPSILQALERIARWRPSQKTHK